MYIAPSMLKSHDILGNHIVDKGFGYDQIYLFYLFKLDSTSKRKREIHEQISQTH